MSAPAPVAFWIAQFNIQNPDYRSTQNSAQSWSKRLPLIVRALRAGTTATKGASVLLLNECPLHCASDIAARLGSDWTWDRVGVNVVMRPNSKWIERGLIERVLPGNGTRSIVAVKLQRRGTPTVVTFGSTHFETLASGFARNSADAQAWRDRQARDAVASVRSRPAIIGGDFNDTDTKTGPRAIFRKAGLLPLADRLTIQHDHGSSDSGKKIDDICTSRDLAVTFAERVDPGAGSDHKLTRVRVVANPAPDPA